MPLIRDVAAAELSPYIAQHRNNPVDWHTWGDEAFAAARDLDRPLFVSIGYSSCHWCHVMAHESFEDATTAAAINERFVAIKVDREERPDVDAIYMEAVQAMTGRGGWPLTIFLAPDGRPFFGGTYFPKLAQGGAPAFMTVLDAVSTAWVDRRQEILDQADELTRTVADRLTPPAPAGGAALSASDLLVKAVDRFATMFDPVYGGIGRAPKFPQAPMLELLLRAHLRGDDRALPMLVTTLEAMASGGIYDHLGGGFSRYSVDRFWLVPHFEKMLYDQAALARVYLHAWQVTDDPRWLQVVTETIEYLLRDMRDPTGGIRAAEDADSSGEEGLFYTWTPEEIIEVLGPTADEAMEWYGVTGAPNFEGGRFILHRRDRGELIRPGEIEAARQRLFGQRAERERPGVDDKVLTEWNAMACSMLCEAAAATGNEAWAAAATELGELCYSALRRPDGRLYRSLQTGHPHHLAVAADYAWMVDCCTRLGELTGRAVFTERAVEMADQLIALFSAPDGGWFVTGSDAEALVVRPVDTYDGVTPAAGSVAAQALSRLGAITGEPRFSERARSTIAAARTPLEQSPIAFSHLIGAALSEDDGLLEIVIAGHDSALRQRAQRRFLPESVLAWGEPTESPLWTGREDGRAYVCEGGTCLLPTGDPNELEDLIDDALGARRA